jgi:hypothetical protein
MAQPMTEAELEAMLARAGIPFSPAQRAGLLPALPGLAAMQALVRTPPLAAEAEPATTFAASDTGERGR